MNEYARSVRKIYFPQDNPRKFNSTTFDREIRGAMNYGAVVVLQDVLKEAKDLNREELIGELQKALQEQYSHAKKNLKIKIPEMKLEEFIELGN